MAGTTADTHYMDVLAIGLTAALLFGRIGCFLNGCCYGKPTDLPWGVRFPYGSFSYSSQVSPDLHRHRPQPYFTLPPGYLGYTNDKGEYISDLKPEKYLTPEQRELVTKGPYLALPVHPRSCIPRRCGSARPDSLRLLAPRPARGSSGPLSSVDETRLDLQPHVRSLCRQAVFH
jgi:hypothetical protein